MVDRDLILGALYSGALALDPPWNTSEVCAGRGHPSWKKDDLRVTEQPLFTVSVRAACVFSIGAVPDTWLAYPVTG